MKLTLKNHKLAKGLFAFVLIGGLVSPLASTALSREDLGQPNPRADLYRGDNITQYSGSRNTVASGISASCSPSLLNATIGQPVTWFSSVTGGSGLYVYTWSGTDGLSGNTDSISATYSTNGEKFASLTVASGNRMVTVSCGGIRIGAPVATYGSYVPSYGLGASCYATPERVAPGESVTWLAIVSGATASTTYAWDGTDELHSDRPLVSKTYGTPGIKAALLTVTSGNARVVASCTNAVSVAVRVPATPRPVTIVSVPQTSELKGICAPSSALANTDDEVTWQSAVIGGNGAYQYFWNGDDELSGNASTTRKTYTTEGVKKASVTVISGDMNTSVSCATIDIQRRGSGLLAASLFSWIPGPVYLFFGIVLAIVIGVLIAKRKKKQEEKEEEKDHVN